MRHLYFSFLISVFLSSAFIVPNYIFADNHKTLAIGSPAPDFKLAGVDGKMYSLSSFKNAKILLVIIALQLRLMKTD
jgi:hypothetical protein